MKIVFDRIPLVWEESLKTLVDVSIRQHVAEHHNVCRTVIVRPYPATLTINGQQFPPGTGVTLRAETDHGQMTFGAVYTEDHWQLIPVLNTKWPRRRRGTNNAGSGLR
ncbi:MAG: hypothetical protein RLZZ360_932 [Candidatus Parcubacteria bacterium]|jgi:hypothetical protein